MFIRPLSTLLLAFCCILLACGNGDRNAEDQEESSKEKAENESKNSQWKGIELPDGFEAKVLAEELGAGRDIVVRSNGNIYVLLPAQKDGHGLVAMRDKEMDGKIDSTVYFGKHSGRGSLRIRNGYLYHSTDSSVLRTAFKSKNELVPSGKTETIVEGFHDHGQHGNKNFAISGEDKLYVTVGAPSNACQKEARTPGSMGEDPCPLLEKYGGVWKFDADEKGQDQLKDGERFATGIRNMVAVDWNEKVGELYGVQHGRDQLHEFFPEKFSKDESATLPAEEMFLIQEGDDFGWPYCYYDGKKDQKVLAPEYGGDGDSIGRCKEKKDPIAHFPAHFAPNNLQFYHGSSFPERYKNGAFIAFHGSWNRNEHKQWGYNVTFVPFDGKKPSGDWEAFAKKFEGPERVDSPGEAEYRPCGLTVGPEGALYIVDSQKGRVWKVRYKG